MNIALINPEYPSASFVDHGGIATYVYTMANAFSDLGHNVFVIAREGTLPDKLNPTISFHTFRHSPVAGLFSWWNKQFHDSLYWEQGCSQAARELVLSIYAKQGIDIVEIPEYNGIAYQFKQPLPFPVVITFHMPTELVDELNGVSLTKQHAQVYAYEKKAAKNGTAFRCPSNALSAKISGRFDLPSAHIEIIQNPIAALPPEAIAKRSNKNAATFDIIFSGRLEPRKGAGIILKSINSLLDVSPNIQITFAGETRINNQMNYRDAIEHAIPQEKRKRVWFLGPVDRYRLTALLFQSDAFFIPSLFENSPYSLLEAMAARLPIVGAHTSGISEIIQHKYNGLLFSLDSPEQIGTCFRELITQPELREKIAGNAYDSVNKNHAPSAIAQQSIAWYNTVLSSNNL